MCIVLARERPFASDDTEMMLDLSNKGGGHGDTV